MNRLFRWGSLAGLVGLAAATGVVVWSGWPEVSAALAQTGWGIVAIALFHLATMQISTAGWWVLVPGKRAPSFRSFVFFMWVRAAVNCLLPVARIGGEVAAVRLMTAHGMRQASAIAATVVELTLSVVAIFVFVLMGVTMFALHINDADIVRQLAWGLVLALPVVAALIAVQRIGFFKLLLRLFRLMFRDHWVSLAGDAARLDRAVRALYRNRRRVLACGILQFVTWALGSVEIWMALRFLGTPLPLNESFMLEALIQGSASAAFAIPGALGVQEAGFIVFGGMLGLPHGTAAALAVLRRCRDLLCYAPALVVWQAHEGKRLWRK